VGFPIASAVVCKDIFFYGKVQVKNIMRDIYGIKFREHINENVSVNI
jgi:hypothetical protein